ncbi:MAG: ferredoxin-type protein NapF [Zoogloeaceae bacterium]|jgi:ferredoxin-type protein NapF|nr:ferredoxin-type protein NapF [Zoogloeaceae bacterium]
MTDISRRQFLRGDFTGKRPALPRPPWARPEAAFAAACTRCCDCVNLCPQHILTLDREARPTVDFSRGECTFCGRCVEACAPRALEKCGEAPPWELKARIGGGCLAKTNVTCHACGDACPAQAIRFRPAVMTAAQPEVDEPLCTGCGACQTPCPVQAIRIA